MELVHPLDGLDDHPWASFSHAYGTAEDLPELLRALAGTDEEAAEEALSELYGSVLHQGTVYGASAEAVPFLAGMAVAGHRTADVLVLLGGMAESGDERGVAPGVVRAAVTDRLPLLLPLLAAPDPGVRRTAAWAVSHTRAAAALPALLARWETETEPAVRAELLAGLARIAPPSAVAAADAVLESFESGEVLLAAVLARLDTGAPWTEAMHQAMLALLPADSVASDLDFERSEPLCAVVEALLLRDRETEREAALALVDAALRDARAEVRAEGLWAADRACMLSRSAPGRLVGSLCASVTDDASALDAASLLGGLGEAAGPAAAFLVPLAARNPDRADDHADRALAALVLIAPGRAAPFLAAALGRRPRALGATTELRQRTGATVPFDRKLLDAVRDRLSRPGELTGNEPSYLLQLAASWGADAARALPELCGMLPHHPEQAPRAVAAVASDCAPAVRARAVEALRTAADRGALAAAKALHELDGTAEPLLRCLDRELRSGGGRDGDAARTAAGLGPGGAVLAPALRAAFNGTGTTGPELDGDTAVAEALWRITGDADGTVAALDSVFERAGRNAWSRWQVVRAARAAALLGPAGRPLTARLEAALGDPEQVPAVVSALLAVAGPAVPDRVALAAAVLRSAESEADPEGACRALEALGADAMTPGHLSRLAALADGDARTVRSGLEGRIIVQDEEFRRQARALLAAFTDRPAS
ncbi:HEAT repeat domain-containing protein [Streptomyces sp. NPDC003691]